MLQKQDVVSYEEWMKTCQQHLQKEKAFTRLRDQLSEQRRALPWTKVEKEYRFDSEAGHQSLSDLFAGKSQLIVYHFMFGPDWEAGCPSCSFWADNFNSIDVHLNARDITLIAVSRAPLKKLQAYKKRMGWVFNWVSSFESDFNADFAVSFTEEELNSGQRYYNFKTSGFPVSEAPGVSVLYKNEEGEIFRTYSCYARGLDILNGAYNYMDIAPKGRDESELPMPMAWVRRRDEYDV